MLIFWLCNDIQITDFAEWNAIMVQTAAAYLNFFVDSVYASIYVFFPNHW